MDNYAKINKCKQIYFGARRSANSFHYKNGYNGTCLMHSYCATKKDLESILKKYDITEYSYSVYNNTVHQFRFDAKHIENKKFVDEIDNSDLDIGCILTFTKQIPIKDLEKNITTQC